MPERCGCNLTQKAEPQKSASPRPETATCQPSSNTPRTAELRTLRKVHVGPCRAEAWRPPFLKFPFPLSCDLSRESQQSKDVNPKHRHEVPVPRRNVDHDAACLNRL